LDGGKARVVRAREVHVRVRLEDELLLVAIHADCEPAAVTLACFPGEAFPADGERDSTGGRGLDLREGERKFADRVPVGPRLVRAGDELVDEPLWGSQEPRVLDALT
jgi:hypothetical protein